ncbi:MAG: DUF805 domain-containing protein [Verrucomicrobia bacterium]|nr:DUF805 domain-containing protein [Verrucomicrobiota bacterium]
MTNKYGNYTLENRIGREKYWAELAIFTLSSSLIYGVGIVAIVFAVLAGGQAGSFLLFIVFAGFQLALTWRFLGYGAKRCHDLGHSGFYQLIPLYPLLMLFQEGDAGDNEYGPNPHGVTKNIAEKVKLFREAADQGDAEAQAKLGYAYYHGSGVVKDEIEAYAYLNLVRMTDENVSRNLAILEKDMSPDQIAAGQKRTKELQKEIAAKLATKYAEFEAFEGCKAKAEKGDRVAQFSLGVCYRDGAGVAKDETQAVSWYHKAAEQGDAKAQYILGVCYENGAGVAKDEVQAISWYRKAADQGLALAQYNLGVCYARGHGVAKDFVKTVTWFRKAADQGYAKAQFNLGVCYYDGTGVVKDPVEAYAYWNLAGTTEEDACKNLAILEKKLSPEARLQGQQRTKELQKEIEAKIAAKQAGK